MKELAIVNKRDYRFFGAVAIAITCMLCITFLAAWFRTPEAFTAAGGTYTTVFAYFLQPPKPADKIKEILNKDPTNEKKIDKKNQQIEQLKKLLEESQVKLNSSGSQLHIK